MKTIKYIELFTFIFFWGVFLAKSIILRSHGIKVFNMGKGKKFNEKILELIFLPVYLIWILVVANSLFKPIAIDLPGFFTDPLFTGSILIYMGVALLILSLFMLAAALISFGDSWRVGIDDSSPGELVVKGIFSMSRNPVFVSINCYLLGVAALHTNMFFLITAGIMLFLIHKQILNEEKHLLLIYKNVYEEYKKKTPRYLGFI